MMKGSKKMKYSIVYSSQTGNTKLLADHIYEQLQKEDCVYQGTANEEALKADRIYIGFWTDKGKCDPKTEEFLQTLTNQEVFLFGTAGFGESAAYFEQIIKRTEAAIPEGVKVVGNYMCQGKMPASVRERYVKMSAAPEMKEKMENLIRNFDAALSHPDAQDLEKLKEAVESSR